jgi:HEPN domain-containing protein
VELPFDTIYTTNFDLLLEDAYSEETRPFRSLVGELQLPFHAGRTASSIIKMHGDLRHEEHIVVTQHDYDSFMDRYPVVATHLSAMLITRTPLFIGYSLSDPDFENIRKVVRARLGEFERMAYVIQFDVDSQQVEEALSAKLHIISLDSGSATSRDEVLASFFSEVQGQLDTKAGVSLRSSRPDLFEQVETEVVQEAVLSPDQAPIIEATSKLCFVMMPFGKRFDEVYRLVIAPAARDNGLTALRADEMAGPGFIMEQIRTAIQQSRLCVADLTGSNANVLYEIGYAQAMGKALVLLAERGSRLPFDVAHQRVVFYGPELDLAQEALQGAISVALSSFRLDEAQRLFELGHYRGAIAAGAVVLEQSLRQVLARKPPERFGRMTLGQMLEAARQRRLIKASLGTRLGKVVQIRNRAVHGLEMPSREEAQYVLAALREVLDSPHLAEAAE